MPKIQFIGNALSSSVSGHAERSVCRHYNEFMHVRACRCSFPRREQAIYSFLTCASDLPSSSVVIFAPSCHAPISQFAPSQDMAHTSFLCPEPCDAFPTGPPRAGRSHGDETDHVFAATLFALQTMKDSVVYYLCVRCVSALSSTIGHCCLGRVMTQTGNRPPTKLYICWCGVPSRLW